MTDLLLPKSPSVNTQIDEEHDVHIRMFQKQNQSPKKKLSTSRVRSNSPTSVRDHGEVRSHLEKYFVELTWMQIFQAFVWNPVISGGFNIFFICYNFATLSGHKSDYQKSDLQASDTLVTYVEFIGLCIILFCFLFHLIFTKNFAACSDFFQLSGQWSAFKLFYQFRPTYIFNYLIEIYQNNVFNYEKTVQQENKQVLNELEQMKEKILSKKKQNDEPELEHKEYVSDNNDGRNKHDINSLKSTEKLIELIKTKAKQPENKAKQVNKSKKKKKFWGDKHSKNIPFIICFLWICCSLIFGLIVGFLSLILKLSQFSFINDNRVSNWSLFGEWYYLLGFGNQLWNMVNQDNLIIHSILEFLYIDVVSFEINRDSRYKIMSMESVIKSTLIKYHGWRGFLLSAGLNCQIMAKILKKNPYDDVITASKWLKKQATPRVGGSGGDKYTCNNNNGDQSIENSKQKLSMSAKVLAATAKVSSQIKQFINFGNNSKIERMKAQSQAIWILKERYHSLKRAQLKILKPILVKYKTKSDYIATTFKIKYKYDIFDSHKHSKKCYDKIALNAMSHGSYIFDWIMLHQDEIFGLFFIFFLLSSIILGMVALIADPAVSQVYYQGTKHNICKEVEDSSGDGKDDSTYHHDSDIWYANLICFVLHCYSFVMLCCSFYFSHLFPSNKCVFIKNLVEGCAGVILGLGWVSYAFYLFVIGIYILDMTGDEIGVYDKTNLSECWNYLITHHTALMVSVIWNCFVVYVFWFHVVVGLVLRGILHMAQIISAVTLAVWVCMDATYFGFLVAFACFWQLNDDFSRNDGITQAQKENCGIMLHVLYVIFVLYCLSPTLYGIRLISLFISANINISTCNTCTRSNRMVHFVESTGAINRYIINGLIIILTIILSILTQYYYNDDSSYCYQYLHSHSSESKRIANFRVTVLLGFIFICSHVFGLVIHRLISNTLGTSGWERRQEMDIWSLRLFPWVGLIFGLFYLPSLCCMKECCDKSEEQAKMFYDRYMELGGESRITRTINKIHTGICNWCKQNKSPQTPDMDIDNLDMYYDYELNTILVSLDEQSDQTMSSVAKS